MMARRFFPLFCCCLFEPSLPKLFSGVFHLTEAIKEFLSSTLFFPSEFYKLFLLQALQQIIFSIYVFVLTWCLPLMHFLLLSRFVCLVLYDIGHAT